MQQFTAAVFSQNCSIVHRRKCYTAWLQSEIIRCNQQS